MIFPTEVDFSLEGLYICLLGFFNNIHLRLDNAEITYGQSVWFCNHTNLLANIKTCTDGQLVNISARVLARRAQQSMTVL